MAEPATPDPPQPASPLPGEPMYGMNRSLVISYAREMPDRQEYIQAAAGIKHDADCAHMRRHKCDCGVAEVEREQEFIHAANALPGLTAERDNLRNERDRFKTAAEVFESVLGGVMQERDALAKEVERLREQVNALIKSCYYRTRAGRVCWKQGNWFGMSTAKETDPASYEEAMAAIRHNAGITEESRPMTAKATPDDIDRLPPEALNRLAGDLVQHHPELVPFEPAKLSWDLVTLIEKATPLMTIKEQKRFCEALTRAACKALREGGTDA